MLRIPVLAVVLTGARLFAQPGTDSPKSGELYRTVAALDAALFEAYNRCDLAKFGSLIAEDVEFYHDKGGITLGRASLTESIKNNICGKVRRELVAGTLEVYPMRGIGAVEMGVHRFYEGGAAKPSGEAKFIQLWSNRDGAWKVIRVISYDHGPLPK